MEPFRIGDHMGKIVLRHEKSWFERDGRRARKDRGLVLFVVAVILVILCLGGTTMLVYMRTESEAAWVRTLELQLENSARSAVALMQGMLKSSDVARNELGGVYSNPGLFAFQPIHSEARGDRDEIRFTILAPEFRGEKIEGIRYGLVNESTRLNLAAVLQWERETPGLGRQTLMKLPGMTTIQADSILDWIDSDDHTRAQGAENQWYALRSLPYSTRGTVPVFLEELLLVRDVTRLQLYGTDEAMNFCNIAAVESTNVMMPMVQGTNEPSGGVPWSYLLTVFSAERDVNPEGMTRLDLNTDDLQFLHEELKACLGQRWADFIVLYRQYGPGVPATDEGGAEGEVPEASPDFSLSGQHKFKTPLDLVRVAITVPGSVFKQGEESDTSRRLVSPLAGDTGAESLFKLLDYVSVGTNTTIVGRINVNESPRPVLRCIPHLTESNVDRIVATRPAPTGSNTNEYRHASWLYTEGIVDLATMKNIYMKVTTGGDVFRGQIVAFAPYRGACCRVESVVDGSITPPRQVFYKNLTSYGRGFSQEILQGKQGESNAFE